MALQGKHLLAQSAKIVVVISLALAALACAWTSLVAIVNFGLRYPAFDQWRSYRSYFDLPFPANAIQLDNGHRPILPVLVRLAEIRWFDANQLLQLYGGTIAAILAAALVMATIVRERAMPAVARAAACALTALALFWLGNARMLMHGNESLHVYPIMLLCTVALLATDAARTSARPAVPMLAAAVCCAAATFCFGTGIATFAAVALVAIMVRVPVRALTLPAALCAITAAIYLFVLPGDGGVRGSLQFDPLANTALLARWLSAPWMRAWLGQADPPLEPWLQGSLLATPIGAFLVGVARRFAEPFGDAWLAAGSVIVGALGFGAYALAAWRAWRRRGEASRLQVLGFGLASFALAAGALICLARLTFFRESPEQVYADRYLPWSCVFWLGIGLHALAGVRLRSAARSIGFVAVVAAILLQFMPSHRAMAGWSATVHRHVQQSAVAAQLGIWDPQRFPDGGDASRADVLATLARLRSLRLSMYAEPAMAALDAQWKAPASMPAPLAGAGARIVRSFDDASGRRIGAFEGSLTRIEHRGRDPVLVVLDAAGAVRGLAKVDYISTGTTSLLRRVVQKRGFDGYVIDPQPGEALSILVLDASTAHVLARVPLMIPVANSRVGE